MEATVSFDITVPEGTRRKQLLEFLNFELQMINSLSADNPLIEKEIGELKPRFLIVGIYPDK